MSTMMILRKITQIIMRKERKMMMLMRTQMTMLMKQLKRLKVLREKQNVRNSSKFIFLITFI